MKNSGGFFSAAFEKRGNAYILEMKSQNNKTEFDYGGHS